jgi:hypothetical protein
MHNKKKPWIAQHFKDGKLYYSSTHATEKEAALAYNQAVLSLNPIICTLNNL